MRGSGPGRQGQRALAWAPCSICGAQGAIVGASRAMRDLPALSAPRSVDSALLPSAGLNPLQARSVLVRAAAEEVKTASTNGAPQKATAAAVDFDELTELIKWGGPPESYCDALSQCIAARVVAGSLHQPCSLRKRRNVSHLPPPRHRMVHTTDIVELELNSKKFKLSVKKREALEAAEPQVIHMPAAPAAYAAPAPVATPAPAAPAAAPAPAAPAAPAPAPAAAAPAPAAAGPVDGLEVVSPMAGTMYRSPAPGEPVFVKEGDRVTKGQVVCIIEGELEGGWRALAEGEEGREGGWAGREHRQQADALPASACAQAYRGLMFSLLQQ